MTLNCSHIFIVTGSFLYWCVMRPACRRFFIHSCIYLRILIISYLATFLGTNSLSVLKCRKAVNQSTNTFTSHLFFPYSEPVSTSRLSSDGRRDKITTPVLLMCLLTEHGRPWTIFIELFSRVRCASRGRCVRSYRVFIRWFTRNLRQNTWMSVYFATCYFLFLERTIDEGKRSETHGRALHPCGCNST